MSDFSHAGLLRQFASLLDFSNDMARNRDDAQWAYDGKEILYVLDTSVFSTFIYPADWSRSMRVLSWQAPNRKEQEDLTFYEQYSAMVSAEYLVSVPAPGARSREIFLSPWHGKELSSYLSKEFRSLVNKVKLASKSSDENSPLSNEVRMKLELVQRAREIKDPKKSTLLNRAEITKRAARIIINSDVAEPLDQIYRLTSQDIRERFELLDTRFPIDDEELDYIRAEARQWYERINSEVEQKKSFRKRKSNSALWNDAFTIAYVLWISKVRLRDDQRIVFVTADMGVFDSYRRWFINRDATTSEYYLPFAFRRLSQFAPLINLVDAESDLSDFIASRQEAFSVFDDISNSVEMALIPFNLSRLNKNTLDQKAQMMSLRGRELLALGARGETANDHQDTFIAYERYLSDDWFSTQRNKLHTVGKLWQQLHEASTGLFFERIRSRIDDDFGLSIDDIEALDRVGGQADGVEHFRKLAQELSHEASESAVESARKLIERSEYMEGPNSRRLPKTIWYELEEDLNVEKLLLEWRKGTHAGRSLTRLAASPTSVLVLASAIALSQSDWTNADVYSTRALVASTHENNFQLAEVKFLRALCCRFKLGFISTHLDGFGGNPSADVLAQCARLISSCYSEGTTQLNAVYEETASNSDRRRRTLLQLRTISEQVALKLFYFSSLGTSPFRIMPSSKKDILRQLTSEVRELLRAGFETYDAVRSPNEDFREIESQMVLNAAATEVLEAIVVEDRRELDGNWIQGVAKRIDKAKSLNLESRSSVVRAEVYAFMLLAGMKNSSAFAELELATGEGRGAELALDRSICRRIESSKQKLLGYKMN